MTQHESGRLALMVDDSRVIRAIVGRAMQELGFKTEEAGDGQAALERLKSGPPPAVMLIDWNMPGLNGLELVQAIRANPEWSDVRLVMITSENEIDRVEKALEAGADEYIMKPFTKDMIQEKLTLIGVPVPSLVGKV
jgi:two-component system, chemotaxis family, chemotaxis protein CheY